MPVNFSIKNVPDELAEKLRERAQRNHRSLQGELMAILEWAVKGSQRLTPSELVREVRAEGYASEDQSTAWIREDRDAR